MSSVEGLESKIFNYKVDFDFIITPETRQGEACDHLKLVRCFIPKQSDGTKCGWHFFIIGSQLNNRFMTSLFEWADKYFAEHLLYFHGMKDEEKRCRIILNPTGRYEEFCKSSNATKWISLERDVEMRIST